ncbi:hypothetical protein AKJ09_09626 [Labilithrix luteola]|uniref:FHA domain-containing protein n=1 Tax=Labilithrix luteola TaxID=1391654 RepID=A0A0K1QB51_9BACT|nr:FHA domain-containing protein [Labilithrix luteola]AKV02963.1 hypothetical protein AKJ09_09626 [Labilithrix luteola]
MLHAYIARAHSLSETEFVQAYPDPVLVFVPSDADDEQRRAFRTRMAPQVAGPTTLPRSADRLELLPIRKRPGGIYPDNISVGRTRATDLHLSHPQVSKMHGYFNKDESGAWAFTDTGATNGTFVNGLRIAQKTRVELGERAQISFGSYECMFLMGKALRIFLTGFPAE